MEEKETFFITAKEYGALVHIRGLKENAHFLVMCAGPTSGGYKLHGSSEAFGELTSDLSDEIFYELSPKTRLAQLRKLYLRLAPDDDF